MCSARARVCASNVRVSVSMYASVRAFVRVPIYAHVCICACVRACVRACLLTKLCEPMQISSHAKCHNVTSKIYIALYDGPVPGNRIVFHCSCSVCQPMYVAFSCKKKGFLLSEFGRCGNR